MIKQFYRTKLRLDNLFLYSAFLCFVIISSYEAPLSFDTPFPSIIVSILFLMLYAILNLKTKIKIDFIIFPVILRTVLFSLNVGLLGLSFETILGEVATVSTCLLIFISVRNFGTYNVIKSIFLIFSFLISIQLGISFISNGLTDKANILSGIGASNYAGAFLVVCIAYLLFTPLNKFQWIIVIIDTVMLLLTLSFGAYLALVVLFFIFLKKNFNWHKKATRRNAFLILVFLIFAIFIFVNTDLGSPIVLKIEEKLGALIKGDWKVFGSSRIEIFKYSFKNFSKNFLFGNIVNPVEIKHDYIYYFEDDRAHNFLLESLVRYGLCGTALNAYIFYRIIKKCRQYIKVDKCAYATLIAIITALLHGLVEPNFFTMHFELLIWLLLGGLWSLDRRYSVITSSKVQNLNKRYSANFALQ